MRDGSSRIASVVGIAPSALTDDNTPAAVDLQGYDSALIQIAVGAGGITFTATNKVEFKVTHSTDDSTYTAVAAADVVLGQNADSSVGTGGIVKSLVAAHATADVTEVSYVGGKRYLKILADFGGTHGTATPLAVIVAKGHARIQPA